MKRITRPKEKKKESNIWIAILDMINYEEQMYKSNLYDGNVSETDH